MIFFRTGQMKPDKSEMKRWKYSWKEVLLMARVTPAFLMLVLMAPACQRHLPPEDARKELGRMNIAYNEESFIEAARNGDFVAVNLFLAAGMNPNVRDPGNRLALVYADFYPPSDYDVRRARLQLESQTKDASAGSGMTPLMVAAIAGRAEVVEALIVGGVDVNAKDRLDMTASDYADWKKQSQVVGLLKRAGAKKSNPWLWK
jgi:ankyrin repeat protein